MFFLLSLAWVALTYIFLSLCCWRKHDPPSPREWVPGEGEAGKARLLSPTCSHLTHEESGGAAHTITKQASPSATARCWEQPVFWAQATQKKTDPTKQGISCSKPNPSKKTKTKQKILTVLELWNALIELPNILFFDYFPFSFPQRHYTEANSGSLSQLA